MRLVCEASNTQKGVWRFWAYVEIRLNNIFLGALDLSYVINNIFL